jgi:thioredoxin-related protein
MLATGACGVPASVANAASDEVPLALDLASDGRLARDRGVPIMLVFTREECDFCELLKSAVVKPMILSGEYEDRAIIREVMIDNGPDVVDFQGRTVSPFSVADGFDALLTPTVVIVGPEGEELARRLVGINNVDMYLWYVDKSLAEGAAAIAEGHTKAR